MYLVFGIFIINHVVFAIARPFTACNPDFTVRPSECLRIKTLPDEKRNSIEVKSSRGL
jgi:hypothetical protein